MTSGRPAASAGAGPLPSGSPLLELDGVSTVLAGRVVLDEVSFSVGAGELVGLIGTNGAGKTTLLRTILGLQRPASGRIRLAGVPVGAPRLVGPNRKVPVGYVPQKVLLDPDLPLRARDLVELGADGERLGPRLPSAARHDLVDELLDAVGAAAFADFRVGRLSGGEQQRVLIAHALAGRPQLLLLDEPLANLDLRSGQEVVDLLHRLGVERRIAVLLSSHDINQLLPVMDRVVYLAGGRAVAGSTDEVIRSDVLTRLYGHHVDVLRVHGRVIVVASPDAVLDHDEPGEVAAPAPSRAGS